MSVHYLLFDVSHPFYRIPVVRSLPGEVADEAATELGLVLELLVREVGELRAGLGAEDGEDVALDDHLVMVTVTSVVMMRC